MTDVKIPTYIVYGRTYPSIPGLVTTCSPEPPDGYPHAPNRFCSCKKCKEIEDAMG